MRVYGRSVRHGFSMIEMLIVFAIIGITATMSISYLVAARPHTQLEQAELEVLAVLNAARHTAITEETQTRVVQNQLDVYGANSADPFYTYERLDPASGTWVVELERRLPDLVRFPAGGNTFPSDTIQFNTRGGLVAGGTIRLGTDAEDTTFSGNLATGRFNYGAGNTR